MPPDSLSLLGPHDPPSFMVHNPEGASDLFLTCDHAGNLIPERLGSLGLEPLDLARHIAWDVGASGVARRLSRLLDATLVTQTYSRLVIDCNRNPARQDSIAERSEATDVPGNKGLGEAERQARVAEVFGPYHAAITAQLEGRKAAGRRSLLIAVHSFTPVYHGVTRPWHIGLLYNRDAVLADCFKALLAEEPELCVGDNEPYAVSDDSDYSIPVHGEQRGILSLEIELRHDLIETVAGQEAWAARLARLLTASLQRLGTSA